MPTLTDNSFEIDEYVYREKICLSWRDKNFGVAMVCMPLSGRFQRWMPCPRYPMNKPQVTGIHT